jgi:DNA-binding GntR family transcriptional regulator
MRKPDPRVAEKVRRAIVTLTAIQGYPPSITQLAGVVGVSRTVVFGTLRREERAGRVTHDPGAYRSWRVIEAQPA